MLNQKVEAAIEEIEECCFCKTVKKSHFIKYYWWYNGTRQNWICDECLNGVFDYGAPFRENKYWENIYNTLNNHVKLLQKQNEALNAINKKLLKDNKTLIAKTDSVALTPFNLRPQIK